MYARLRCGGNLPLCLAFGTGEGLLPYIPASIHNEAMLSGPWTSIAQ